MHTTKQVIYLTTFIKNKITIKPAEEDTIDLTRVILTAIGTKLVGRFSRLICELSLKTIY